MAPNKSYREEPFIIKVLTRVVLVLRSSKPEFFICFWLFPAPSSSFTVIQTNMGFFLEPAEEIDYDKCLFYCRMDVWHQSLNTFLSLCIWAIFIISHFKCLPFRAFSFLMTPLHTHSHPRIPATTPDSSTFPVISQHQQWSELQQGLVLQLLLGSLHRRNHQQQQNRKTIAGKMLFLHIDIVTLSRRKMRTNPKESAWQIGAGCDIKETRHDVKQLNWSCRRQRLHFEPWH